MRPAPHALETPQVALAFDDAGTLVNFDDVATILSCRGLTTTRVSLENCSSIEASALAFAPAAPLTPETALVVGAIAREAALANRPMVILVAHSAASSKMVTLRAAAMAYLRRAGAILCSDPDSWLETIALLAGHGIPDGPTLALIAPPGSWLEIGAEALVAEYAAIGARFPAVIREPTAATNKTDIVLMDSDASSPKMFGNTIAIPVVTRAELVSSTPPIVLVGLRSALAAATAVGQFALRRQDLVSGTPVTLNPPPDLARFDRQLAKLGPRGGDHETKVLLAAYGVSITRQAVATTPSAASRIAKQAGYPVEMKPWDPETPPENDGCPVETNLVSAAQVRRAFTALARSNQPGAGTAAIVRETPPSGFDVEVELKRIEPLGWMMTVQFPNRSKPIAASIPLQSADANYLAAQLEASRAQDRTPNRSAFVDLLIRVSQLIVDHPHTFKRLHLARVVVAHAPQVPVVTDAHCLRNTQVS